MGCQGLSATQGYERLTEDLIQQVSKWKEIHLTYMGNEWDPMKRKSQWTDFNVL